MKDSPPAREEGPDGHVVSGMAGSVAYRRRERSDVADGQPSRAAGLDREAAPELGLSSRTTVSYELRQSDRVGS